MAAHPDSSLICDHSWSRALTLAERAALLPKEPSGPPAPEYEGLLERWLAQPPFERRALLSRRLSGDGLDLAGLARVLGQGPEALARQIAMPDWAIRTMDSSAPALPPAQGSQPRSAPLLVAVEPIVRAGYARLIEGLEARVQASPVSFDPRALASSLYQALPPRLALVLGRTLVLELHVARLQDLLQGETPQERYQAFVRRLEDPSVQDSLLAEYAVAARLVTQMVQRWVQFGLEIVDRLQADWAPLGQQLFGSEPPRRLVAIETNVGDPHRGGRSVSVLTFDTGARIVYKPRSLASESAFGRLVAWLNERGLVPSLRSLQVLDRGTHGWMEYAQHQPCRSWAELTRFYERQGALLAILYVLEANDMHFENIVACGEHPLLVDLETLFQPYLDMAAVEGEPLMAARRTVLETGLLPGRIWTGDGGAGVDLSGLSDAAGQSTAPTLLGVVDQGTDEMRYDRVTVTFEGGKNLPTLDGAPVELTAFKGAILDGFCRTYRLIALHRAELAAGPIAAFADAEMRVIFRPTHLYGKLLMESVHPDFLRDALARDLFLDRLWVVVAERPIFERIVPHEHRDITACDIPLFTFRPGAQDLWTSSGERIAGFFQRNSMSHVQQRLAMLDEGDLSRQCWIIEGALRSVSLARLPLQRPSYDLVPEAPADRQALLTAAGEMAARIEALAFRGPQHASWFTWAFVGDGHWNLEPMGPELYDGQIGVALFLAQLGAMTRDSHWTELALHAVATARASWTEHPNKVPCIGAFNGWAGLVYGLARIGQHTDRPDLIDEAIAMVRSIDERIDADLHSDIMIGAAGALVVLLELYRLRPEEALLQTARRCGASILARGVAAGPGTGWIIPDAGPQPLAGLSHGAGGIAWALARLGAVTGERRFVEVAEAALRYERSLYSSEQNNWPDLRVGPRPEPPCADGHHYVTAWCHGAPGVGLARLAMRPYLHDAQTDEEIERAIAKTLADGFGENHALCHGDLGNLDLLLQAARDLKRPALLERAGQLGARIVASTKEQGWHSGLQHNLETPGLMLGWAGTGYQLLRIACPEEVPSVLTLELARGT